MEYTPDFEYTHVLLSEIIGMDSDVEALEKSIRHLALSAVELNRERFRIDILKIAYARAPVLLLKRPKGYVCVGNPLNWKLAKTLFQRDDDKIPALVFNKTRMEKREKLRIFAADLLIPHALFRSRHGLPRALFDLCQELHKMDASPLSESSAKTFSKATGFSVK